MSVQLICQGTHLVEVADDFVEQSETLEALFVDVGFVVELSVVGDRGEHNSHRLVPFVIQALEREQPCD